MAANNSPTGVLWDCQEILDLSAVLNRLKNAHFHNLIAAKSDMLQSVFCLCHCNDIFASEKNYDAIIRTGRRHPDTF